MIQQASSRESGSPLTSISPAPQISLVRYLVIIALVMTSLYARNTICGAAVKVLEISSADIVVVFDN